jgi:hypothetical protein
MIPVFLFFVLDPDKGLNVMTLADTNRLVQCLVGDWRRVNLKKVVQF